MNERIQQLAEQAKAESSQWLGSKPAITMTYDELEKFAELIVRECQTVVEWAISVDSTIDRVPVLIKEHFGVEQ